MWERLSRLILTDFVDSVSSFENIVYCFLEFSAIDYLA